MIHPLRRGLAFSMGLTVALLLFDDATAQTSGTAPVADLQLAQELYQYGQRTQNPLAAIVATRIVANTPTQDTQRAKTEKKAEAGNLPPVETASPAEKPQRQGAAPNRAIEQAGKPGTAAVSGTSAEAGPPDLASMIQTARKMAGDDKNLQAMISEIEGGGSPRGAVAGPAQQVDQVSPQSWAVYRGVQFRGGELAEVAVISAAGTNLDLAVLDENGNVICEDVNVTEQSYCSWRPLQTGPFHIGVLNRGAQPVRFVILTN
jgi:hypothetical protein